MECLVDLWASVWQLICGLNNAERGVDWLWRSQAKVADGRLGEWNASERVDTALRGLAYDSAIGDCNARSFSAVVLKLF